MTHPELVKALKKPGDQILSTLTAEKVNLLYDSIENSIESVEILDSIKKHVIYNKGIDHNLDFGKEWLDRGNSVLETLTPEKASLLHMAILIFGEAGEILDAVSKHIFNNEELNRENVIEEVGDLKFGIEGLLQDLNLSHEDCIDSNLKKLTIRYGNSYSDESAQNRKDKEVGFKFLTES